LPLGDQIRYREDLNRFTESVIREELLFQYALSELDRDRKWRNAAKEALVELFLRKRVEEKAQVSSADVERYYREHPDEMRGEHWRVSHIPLASRAECDAVLPTLTSEDAFERTARERGTDPALAARGGDMGYFMRQHNVLGLGELLFKLPVGKPFAFEDQNGCHIVEVTEHLDPPLPPLEKVRSRLEGFLKARQRSKLLGETMKAAERQIPIVRPGDKEEPPR